MPEAAKEIARRSRGTPRVANRLLRRVRDYAQVRADGTITTDVAARALEMLEVDEHGFDEVDRRLLRTIIDKFGGGPVGVGSLAAALSEERDALEDIYEPFLIQAGFLDRTPRGRVATARAYEYFGLTAPRKDTTCGKRTTSAGSRRAGSSGRSNRRPRRPTCRRGCSRTPTSKRWSTPPTSGSCSAPASASATSPNPASRPPTWRKDAAEGAMREAGHHPRPDRLHRRRHDHAGHDLPEHRVPAAGEDRRQQRVGVRPRRRLLGLHLLADDGDADGRHRRAAITRSPSAPT